MSNLMQDCVADLIFVLSQSSSEIKIKYLSRISEPLKVKAQASSGEDINHTLVTIFRELALACTEGTEVLIMWERIFKE